MISILIVDDHSVVREGIIKIISSLSEVKFYDEARNGIEALKKLTEQHFDVVILDIAMDGMDGMETARQIKKDFTTIKIIMCSSYKEKAQIVELINLGVEGYILKSADKNEIINALKTLEQDGKFYTKEVLEIWNEYKNKRTEEIPDKNKLKLGLREKEIIKLLCEGFTAPKIAEKVSLSESTINTHRHNIMKKLGVKNVVELVNYATHNGLLTKP
jgi:DNA-binding NarL/FixJ family response regulator